MKNYGQQEVVRTTTWTDDNGKEHSQTTIVPSESGAKAGMAIGAAVGSVFGPGGAAIGAALGGTLGGIFGPADDD